MRDAVRSEELTRRLDRVDSLPVGSGRLDLDLFGRGDRYGGIAGGSLGYDHRIREDLSLFAEGWVGLGWGDREALEYEASAGMRWRF